VGGLWISSSRIRSTPRPAQLGEGQIEARGCTIVARRADEVGERPAFFISCGEPLANQRVP
jgi:hypothetical protein